MKVFSILFVTSSFLVSVSGAFGVNNNNNRPSSSSSTRGGTAVSSSSPLFRKEQALLTRGGAVPGWAAYNDALDKKPLTTKAMTSLVGWALGDLLAQIFISGGPFDMKRFLTLSFFGFIYHGPSGHYFYNWLDSKIKGTDAKAVALKVGIDQLAWCPIFMTVFFTYLGLVNGDSISAITKKVQTDLLSAVQGSWKVWPIVHAVNFKFISTKHRLVFINSVQIAFNMFLSLIGTKK